MSEFKTITSDQGPDSTIQPQPNPLGPIVLFDGVCNFCDASVNWILERDSKNQFRFASLQSNAARSELIARGAEHDLPDSIVLLDGDKVLTQSDAIIRIGSKLGFPWKLAPIGRIIPKPMRDWVYAKVARNRYKWFGSKQVCTIPAPDVRAKFLDADEPVQVIESAAQAPAEPKTAGFFTGYPVRLAICYFFLYMFPSPMNAIPYSSYVLGWYMDARAWLTVQSGNLIFGIEEMPGPTGSGDRSIDFAELALVAVAALVASLTWQLMRRGKGIPKEITTSFITYCRFYLASVMLVYGSFKIIPLQMPAPGPDRLIEGIGEMSPMGMLWTFMGTSSAYQIFAGMGETISGLLLLWRKTSLVGALISVGVMANVAAMNYMFDVPVKLFSSHLLFIGLVILSPHFFRLINVLVLHLPTKPADLHPAPIRKLWFVIPVLIVKLYLVYFYVGQTNYRAYQQLYTRGLLAERFEFNDVYRVTSFERNGVVDRENEDDLRWVRIGFQASSISSVMDPDPEDDIEETVTRRTGRMRVQWANGPTTRFGFSLIEETMELTFPTLDGSILNILETESGMVLEGVFEGADVRIALDRIPESEFNLKSRGYNWINEVPFNR